MIWFDEPFFAFHNFILYKRAIDRKLFIQISYYLLSYYYIYIYIIHKYTNFINHRVSLSITNYMPVLLYSIIGVFNNNMFVSLLFIVHRRDVCIFMFFSCLNFYNKSYILYNQQLKRFMLYKYQNIQFFTVQY